ncbi:MAG: hypothetical protein FIA91_02330 [Geobacter sp.]|nr:hypothetical protein [Geobacter sp.]
MKPLLTLIFDDECGACSAIAQLIGARAPDIAKVSFYSPKAQMLLRRHFPGGWAFRPYLIANDGQHEKVLSRSALLWKVMRLLGPVGMIKAAQALLRRSRRQKTRGGWAAAPDVQMRGYVPTCPAEAAAFAGEALMLPDATQTRLRHERTIQWYNLHGAFQTASYWKYDEAGSLVLEQVHRACTMPVVEGVPSEHVQLSNGRNVHCYTSSGADGKPATTTLIAGCDNGRWLALRSTGINRDALLAIARSCTSSRSSVMAAH